MKQRQELGQLDQPFRLTALLRSKCLARILSVEQVLKPCLESVRKLEPSELGGDLDRL